MSKISRRAMMALALPLAAAQKQTNSFFGIYTKLNPGTTAKIRRLLQTVRPDYAQYGPNFSGVWTEGECWQSNPDYSPATLDAWRRMGLGLDAPRKPEDPKWDVWLEFNRQRFRDCVRNSVERLHKERPGTLIASKHLYTTFVPEKPEIPVDFLINSSMSPRLEARYLGQTGKAWGLQISDTQPIIQLKQEASIALAQGGGIQLHLKAFEHLHEVSQFCRERQSLCHKSQSLSDVAILFSRTSLYRKSNQLFGDWGKHVASCAGLLDAIIECHRSVDVMPDWAPLRWPVLVIPEWEEIGDSLAQQLAGQVRDGLNLFLTGAHNARKFSSLFNWRLTGPASLTGLWQDVDPGAGKIISERYSSDTSGRSSKPAAMLFEIGKGRVVLAPGPIETHSPALRQFVGQCLDALGPAQVSIKDNTAPLEIAIRKQGQQTVLHFLNQVSSLPSQQVRLRLALPPKKILWEPSGRAIGFDWRDGNATFTTPPIPLHAMAVID